MPAKKRLIICIACFVIFLGLGLLWAYTDPTYLDGGQRLLISGILGLLVSTALYFVLAQPTYARESRQTTSEFDLSREEFAANVSHEIRTPLSGILGVMHVLRRTELDRDQERYVDTATNSANMLLANIGDVLDYARMDTEKFGIESEGFDLAEVIEDITSILAPEAITQGLELICDIDPTIPQRINGDALRVRQVLNNLLNNAIKYTEQAAIVLYATRLDDHIEIGIKDSDIGIDQVQQQRLLQTSARIETELDQCSGGAGIGLKISRRLIEAMGSELQIDSTPAKGSCFSFRLAIDDEFSASYDWKPPQAMQDLSIGVLSPLEIRRKSIRNMLTHWNISTIQELDYDVEHADALPDISPCDILFIDQTESEQAVNNLIDRFRNHSGWRESRFIHLIPQNREDDGGSADIRLRKPLSHARLYSAIMDIVYKLAFQSEYASDQRTIETGVSGALEGRHILLAEDNEINKMIVLEMLEETGVSVDVAVNGAEAVQQAQRQKYDLILMDIQMPVMDGLEATQAIRELGGEFVTIPIIAMTAHALESDSNKSLEAGMDYYISKPFEPDAFVAVIVRYIDEWSQPG